MKDIKLIFRKYSKHTYVHMWYFSDKSEMIGLHHWLIWHRITQILKSRRHFKPIIILKLASVLLLCRNGYCLYLLCSLRLRNFKPWLSKLWLTITTRSSRGIFDSDSYRYLTGFVHNTNKTYLFS